jgi:hypothetical protein
VTRDDPRGFAAFAVPRGATVTAAAFGAAFAVHRLLPAGPVRWVGSLLIVMTVVVGIFWSLVLSAEQRQLLVRSVRA